MMKIAPSITKILTITIANETDERDVFDYILNSKEEMILEEYVFSSSYHSNEDGIILDLYVNKNFDYLSNNKQYFFEAFSKFYFRILRNCMKEIVEQTREDKILALPQNIDFIINVFPTQPTEKAAFITEGFLTRGYDLSVVDQSPNNFHFKSLYIKKDVCLNVLSVDTYMMLLFLGGSNTYHQIRHGITAHEIFFTNKNNLLDLGCGEGAFLLGMYHVYKNAYAPNKIMGVEIDPIPYKSLNLNLEKHPYKEDIAISNTDITKPHKSFCDYKTITLIEVIEHFLDADLKNLEEILFNYIRPIDLLISTPNADSNIYIKNILNNKGFHHDDNKFEWGKKIYCVGKQYRKTVWL